MFLWWAYYGFEWAFTDCFFVNLEVVFKDELVNPDDAHKDSFVRKL